MTALPVTLAGSSPARPPASRDKRKAILDAATSVFARRGFFQAQVADVARAAGVAAGTVYLYFSSKDDVLASVFERTMREAVAEARALVEAVDDPIEQLGRLAHLHLGRLGRNRDLAVVFQVELRQSTKFMERFSAAQLREYLGIIRDAIARGQSTGAMRPDVNPTVASKILFGALDEMATDWILSQRPRRLEDSADTVVDIFVRGMASSDGTSGERG
ncbi:MAG: TetR/AcrR family transcriptional regulator C-terminal domain-containing protein [Vicinamibacterales bacterium]|jgi:TetR/AcrR family fatty acid metabolism transcriptional regulator|nr:TetR family transcriptional regulator [Acidobacteriota bacterium]MDP7672739.1 TetR/AcrR family transcriptional regulator C-terminal domain-containing protein [Vicinamibacterales bacterium]HJO38318.1 TetR/AcrR family transcriptional regulator C-terminal domain-containing protein [Vicinamibacterales bacterium]|tara:strand:- start:17 stop:670 length:654 start_codon:yes stop_codon:yes gene_type:complete